MTQTIEQLTARVRELEEENKLLRSAVALQESGLLQQLAASQLHAEQLREALDYLCNKSIGYTAKQNARKALSLPRDTSALNSYVAEKVKEAMK